MKAQQFFFSTSPRESTYMYIFSLTAEVVCLCRVNIYPDGVFFEKLLLIDSTAPLYTYIIC